MLDTFWTLEKASCHDFEIVFTIALYGRPFWFSCNPTYRVLLYSMIISITAHSKLCYWPGGGPLAWANYICCLQPEYMQYSTCSAWAVITAHFSFINTQMGSDNPLF